MNVIILIPVIVILFFVITSPFLQVYLSLKQNKLIGLILPVVTMLLTIVLPIIVNLAEPNSISILILYSIIGSGIIFMYLVIYFVCRQRVKKLSNHKSNEDYATNELDKMNIKDLG